MEEVSMAFQELLKGNVDKHNEMLIKAVEELSEEVDSIVLAQLSMSALAPLLTEAQTLLQFCKEQLYAAEKSCQSLLDFNYNA